MENEVRTQCLTNLQLLPARPPLPVCAESLVVSPLASTSRHLLHPTFPPPSASGQADVESQSVRRSPLAH